MAHRLVNMIADQEELMFFFHNCLFPLEPDESYSMVLVSRHKKLSAEEKAITGLTRNEAEFLKPEVLRRPKFKQLSDVKDKNITFEGFYKAVCRLNFDEDAYLCPNGDPLPLKTLAVLFYVNPCDDTKVWTEVSTKIQATMMSIVKAKKNGKNDLDFAQSMQAFGNLLSDVKHAKALCKGKVYWSDFDIDVPDWWKGGKEYEKMKKVFDAFVGRGNYIVIQTSGGYHVLVRSSDIHDNPKKMVCEKIEEIYRKAVYEGKPPYLDEKGKVKFECVQAGPGIPGVPLPGTYQYGNPVRIINKEDFYGD